MLSNHNPRVGGSSPSSGIARTGCKRPGFPLAEAARSPFGRTPARLDVRLTPGRSAIARGHVSLRGRVDRLLDTGGAQHVQARGASGGSGCRAQQPEPLVSPPRRLLGPNFWTHNGEEASVWTECNHQVWAVHIRARTPGMVCRL